MPDTRTLPSRLCYRAVEFRAAAAATGDGRTLEGYAAVFDTPTEIQDWSGSYNEQISRGAFKRTLGQRMPVLQFDHGRDARTGTVPIGTINECREDKKGLYTLARLFDNDVVEPIRQAIEGKAIDGMSFRFRVIRDKWTDNKGVEVEGTELLDLLWQPGDRGPLLRTILEVDLFELGPVVFPAYDTTSVGVRSMLAGLNREDREALVRDLANELRQSTDDGPGQQPTPPADDTGEPPDVSAPDEPVEDDTQEPAEPGTSATAADTPSPERNSTMDPMTVEERAARQSEIRAELAEIDTQYAGAALPDDVQARWDALDAELREHVAAVTAAEERRARLAELADDPARSENRSTAERRAAGSRPTQSRAPENLYDLREYRTRASSIDDLPQLYRDGARRAIEQATFPGVESREAAQGAAERLLLTVDDPHGDLPRRMLATGSPLYSRAFGKAVSRLSRDGLSAEEERALALGVDADGGFAVPFQLDPTIILTSNGAINPLRSISRVERIVGKEWQGITSAGITVTRGDEGDEAGDNAPTLTQPTVRAERVQGFVPFSVEIDQDWNALQSEMTRLLADAKDVEEATSFVTGNGTAPNAGGIVATLAAGSQVTTATAATFAVADVYKTKNALPPRFRARGKWLAETSIYDTVRQFGTSTMANVWVEQLQDGIPARLVGYGAYEQSSMASTVATGNLILLFGDFQQFLIVDRVGMSVELVPHLFGANGRPTGQRGIYAMWRNNSKILTSAAFRLLKVG